MHSGDGFGDGDNEAVEEAHDHCFPSWRTLPPITTVEDRWAVLQTRSRGAQLTAQYPPGWINQGAPVLARSRYRREAHAPPHAGRPRYELPVNPATESTWATTPQTNGLLMTAVLGIRARPT